MDEEINPHELDFYEKYYWPALRVFYAAIEQYEEAIQKDLRPKKDDPVTIEMYRAYEEWLTQLHGLDFVRKMYKD